MPPSYNRTMAVEIGTQSAGLSSGMSAKFFTPEAALPGAVAAVLHNITGALYSAIVRWFSSEIPENSGSNDADVVAPVTPTSN